MRPLYLGSIPMVASLALVANARLLLFYPLNETTGTQATDFSGNGRHGRYVGGPQLTGAEGVRLDGSNDYVQMPNDLMRGLNSLTVSMDVRIRAEQSGYYFIFGIGNTGRNGDGDGYVFATGNPLRAAITPGDFNSEAEVRTNGDLPRDTWRTITFVIDGNAKTLALYQDGVYNGGLTSQYPIVTPASIGSGSTTANYIGRSTYSRDRYLAGSVRNFRLWDTALSANEVSNPRFPVPDTPGSDIDRVSSALGSLNVPGLDNVRGNINLPNMWNGLPVIWTSSNPSIISNTGMVTRPQSGDIIVTLTATIISGDIQGQRPFTALVRRAGT
jgi:hypothetical protein